MTLQTGLKQLDSLLRGEATRSEVLRTGDIAIHPGQLFIVNLVLGIMAGFCLGWFALVNKQFEGVWQVVSCMIKVPALFLLTFLVTLPSLYVFNAIFQSRLGFWGVVKLLLATLAIIHALIASLGPIIAFFSLTTESYGFMVLFTVFVFGTSGAFGMYFLLKTLKQMTQLLDEAAQPTQDVDELEDADHTKSMKEIHQAVREQEVLDHQISKRVRSIFSVWLLLFMVVGMQMAWILRPFLGNPSEPFMWFRARNGNFFQSFVQTLQGLLGLHI